MNCFSRSRGWKVIFKSGTLKYSNTNVYYDERRPCKRCGAPPSKDGHDSCIANLPGVLYACCGHGHPGYSYILFDDGKRVEPSNAQLFFLRNSYTRNSMLQKLRKGV